MSVLWTILIGFIVGVIAKWLKGGGNAPEGFILTTVLGVAGGFFFTWLGQQLGFYGPNEQAGFLGSIFGAVIVLMIWGAATRKS
ncbi:MAG: GlsB/YeaQ/YmgE family stress response membrane protein [Pseudomonadota bacterium]